MRLSFIAAAIALVVTGAAHAAVYRLGGLEITQPWSRPAAAGGNGAGFMTVTNNGKAADTLKAVETPAARKVEMHKTSMAGGVMSMQRLDAGVLLAPGQSISFAPGGYHLMLIGLAKATRSGDVIPATLVFASGARIKVEFPVGAGPSAMPGMDMDHMDHMHH
ncbi:MAG TPA: copper chaperone PCu(A)C [Phenylobacterium sp.]|nr:copper chaperone PCu(A)C [Phenylobacterium sp.]